MSASQLFAIGEGTVVLYTQRCCTAIYSLWKEEIRWPTIQERLKAKERIKNSAYSLWENCIGIVDGTFLRFRWRPLTKDISLQYFNHRKKAYGLHATVICDDQRRIIHFTSLFPGAVHDARAFKHTQLWNNPQNFICQDQFILADSAYPLTHWCLTPFKCPRRGQLDDDHKHFNKKLSAFRVRIEHTIGILKARWAFLRCIPNRGGGTRESLKWYYEWIGAAVVLHNLLINTSDEWKDNQVIHHILTQSNKEESTQDEVLDIMIDEQRTRGILRRDQFFLRFLEQEIQQQNNHMI